MFYVLLFLVLYDNTSLVRMTLQYITGHTVNKNISNQTRTALNVLVFLYVMIADIVILLLLAATIAVLRHVINLCCCCC